MRSKRNQTNVRRSFRMQRNALAYVCDRVWHPDHKTVVLDGWHRVFMNTENQAPGARAVVFLD
jgi:hypothetical protein